MTTATAVVANEDDDPKVSSAALCISLDLTGSSFRPEFTHQCFEGEWIRGYQPFHEILQREVKAAQKKKEDSNEAVVLHKSHHNHKDGATRELKICVELAPSGQKCAVHLQVRKKRSQPPPRATKRRRIDSGNHVKYSTASEEDEEEEVVVEEEEDSESGYEGISVVDTPGPTRRRRMPVKDIMERIQKALPAIVKEKQNIGDNYLHKPVGTVLEEYKHRSSDFVICFAHGKDVIDYHHNVQRLALFFIENASDVDLASDAGENWKILYLLRKHRIKKRIKYSLVGYLTLFYFSAPFRKPKPGIVARVCQVLILPPYQRAGHGKRLLHCVHDLAQGKYDGMDDQDIVEINVEDPAPGFVALRNMVDFERLVQSKEEGQPWLSQLNRNSNRVSRTTFATLTDAHVNQAAVVAKVTPLQINICFEIYQLQVLREILQETTDENQKEELEKSYRLMVKKRLTKTHREEFGRGWSKKEMQNRLTELYDALFQQYHVILGIPSESKKGANAIK